ncbi:hypothetical protein P3342_003126 [Pyrenophora teres f. teres]|nr:hypothetical protein P3342_003126 [Pyrenophora teres f. teres]
MATVSTSSSTPALSHQNLAGQPPPTMATQQPQSLSPAYLETHTILTHLLTTLQSPSCPYHKHYSQWITHHTIPTLTTTLLSLIRPPVWTFISTPVWSLDALKQISPYPGDLRYEGRAIYLNGILGLDKRLRVLPVESLRVWLPPDNEEEDGTGVVVSKERRTSREGVMGGLNIACPLDQGLTSFKDQPFVDLSGEEDELVQEWLGELERKREEKEEEERDV